MNEAQYRHEYKHAINLADYHSLRRRLLAVARMDAYAGQDGRYRVRSLYFDNDDDLALREKLYGLPNREKYRIRLYNGDERVIRLEKKSKVNGLCLKQSAALTRAQAERILRGDMALLADSGDAVLAEFYAKARYKRLKPRTIVDYDREAYVFPQGNVRVTFDSNVRTGLYATDLFGEGAALRAQEAGLLLLEVKYDSFLPDIMRDVIQTNTRHTEAFSKYAACRMYG